MGSGRLVPTRVGMILSFGDVSSTVFSCPHTRGDDPSHVSSDSAIADLSPHAWG